MWTWVSLKGEHYTILVELEIYTPQVEQEMSTLAIERRVLNLF